MAEPTLMDIPKNFANTGKDIYVLNTDYAIVEEVKNILSTQFRSKLFDIWFGSPLYDYLFAPVSPAIITIVNKIIKETILTNCNRVKDITSTTEVLDDLLKIKLILKTERKTIETETRFYLR